MKALPKTAVVTGCSTGIGWATAKILLSQGFAVFGSVRKAEDAERATRELGSGFISLLLDVTDGAAVQQAAHQVCSAFVPSAQWSSARWKALSLLPVAFALYESQRIL